MKWLPIETAPKDGTVIFVAGWDWGKKGGKRHYHWAYFHRNEFRPTSDDGTCLCYLSHWTENPGEEPPEDTEQKSA